MKIKKIDVVIAIYIACIAIAELMGAKTIPLAVIGGFQLNASVALLVIPIIFTINDIVTEVYGKERARSVASSGLLVIALLLVMSLIATQLPPSTRFAADEAAYDTIFAKSARIAAASLIAFAAAQLLDVWVFSKLREKMHNRALWLRNNVSNFSAQLIDTILFMTLAFYALDKPLDSNATFLISLIVPYWLLKCLLSIVETPLVYAGVKWLREDKELS